MTIVKVWIQPRASRTELAGLHGDAIKIRIAAPPVDGAANEELVRFVASKLGLPRSAVTILRGQSGRQKVLNVEGIDAATLQKALTATD